MVYIDHTRNSRWRLITHWPNFSCFCNVNTLSSLIGMEVVKAEGEAELGSTHSHCNERRAETNHILKLVFLFCCLGLIHVHYTILHISRYRMNFSAQLSHYPKLRHIFNICNPVLLVSVNKWLKFTYTVSIQYWHRQAQGEAENMLEHA